MLITFKKLGFQSEEDLSFLTDESMIDYAKQLNKGTKKFDLKNALPRNSEPLLSALGSLLFINPFFRSSASEALKLNIFDQIREKGKEQSAPKKILLDIDRDGAFDYETCESKNFGLSDYIRMVQEMSEVIRKERMAFLEQKVSKKTE